MRIACRCVVDLLCAQILNSRGLLEGLVAMAQRSTPSSGLLKAAVTALFSLARCHAVSAVCHTAALFHPPDRGQKCSERIGEESDCARAAGSDQGGGGRECAASGVGGERQHRDWAAHSERTAHLPYPPGVWCDHGPSMARAIAHQSRSS
eukprot:2522030-Rhodomonas_salina.2